MLVLQRSFYQNTFPPSRTFLLSLRVFLLDLQKLLLLRLSFSGLFFKKNPPPSSEEWIFLSGGMGKWGVHLSGGGPGALESRLRKERGGRRGAGENIRLPTWYICKISLTFSCRHIYERRRLHGCAQVFLVWPKKITVVWVAQEAKKGRSKEKTKQPPN